MDGSSIHLCQDLRMTFTLVKLTLSTSRHYIAAKSLLISYYSQQCMNVCTIRQLSNNNLECCTCTHPLVLRAKCIFNATPNVVELNTSSNLKRTQLNVTMCN